MSRVRGGNPSRRTLHTDAIDEAARRLEDFSGHAPTEVLRVPHASPKVTLPIGELDFVGYTTVRDGKTEKYIHRFAKKSRPLLASSHDGTSLHILGGEYEFTEAGIEDR